MCADSLMGMERTLYLAGGCFWGVQHYLSLIRGVNKTCCGYANGHIPNPDYKMVCTDQSGYAETVCVTYDSSVLSTELLLHLFFKIIDPCSHNKQGDDTGTQYRTGVYYTDSEDLPAIERAFEKLRNESRKPIVVECQKLENFYAAEEMHQDYLEKNPTGYCHINPAFFEAARRANAQADSRTEHARKKLSALQYDVTQNGATEPPFDNAYAGEFRPGIYVDILSGEVLFISTDKFESGCGWPAFSRPFTPDAVSEHPDTAYGRVRTEVKSSGANSHLGHVFDDGPKETGGLRYCINSAALRFIPREDMEKEGYANIIPYIEKE